MSEIVTLSVIGQSIQALADERQRLTVHRMCIVRHLNAQLAKIDRQINDCDTQIDVLLGTATTMRRRA